MFLESCSVVFGAPALKLTNFGPKFQLYCLLQLHKILKSWHNMSLLCLIKLTYPWQLVFGVRDTFFGELFSGFWSSSPTIGDFWPQISAILLPAAWQNCKRLVKYVVSLSNQTYLPMTTRFGGQRVVFGELFSGFWTSSPKIGDFWPQISPI